MSSPTLSVLICTFHGESPAYLSACLQSLVDQTLTDFEVVLIRDGDLTDSLETVIDSFRQQLTILDHTYLGDGHLGGGLSEGLLLCNSNWIARMDSDDVCRPNRFEIQLKYMIEHDLDLCSGAIAEFDQMPGDLGQVRFLPEFVQSQHMERANPINHMAAMYKKSTAVAAGNYRVLEGFEDWYLWLRMFAQNARVGNLQEVLVDARIGNEFAARRGGLKYVKREYRAISLFRSEHLISSYHFLFNIFTRLPARFLPRSVLLFLYKLIKRSKLKG